MAIQAQARDASETFILRALDDAHMNALRIALYHQTGDPELEKMRVEAIAPVSTPFLAYVVAREHHADLKAKAFAYLTDPNRQTRSAPEREGALDLMRLFQGDAFDELSAGYGLEELGFDTFPREAQWSEPKRRPIPDGFRVAIIGAGFSGILAGVMLTRLGVDFRIVERQSGIGGTWELNHYPEARVDITTFIYQYSFIKNYPWKSYFASRKELKDYIDHVVDIYELRDRIETDTALTEAHWDEARHHWTLTLQHRDRPAETFDANVVISASGLFSTPKLPDILGIDTYRGTMFHTTAWAHDEPIEGKRVALIGTGSTGSQLMPDLAKRAASLTVYQRTPHWITPVKGYHDRVSNEKRWLLDAMPFYANWFRYSQHIAQMQSQNFHEIDPDWRASGGQISEKNDQLRGALTDYASRKLKSRPDLLARAIPSYAPLARRLVVDNGWFDSLVRDNVELVTDGIECFNEKGIISCDGQSREFDVVVLGSGFKTTHYLWPVAYEGRAGANLEQLWKKDGARAYLTTAMPGFPNFFMLYGPNAGARAGSFHSWMEVLMRYIGSAIVAMLEGGHQTIEVKPEAYDRYNAELDEGLTRMLWQPERGGGGYYVNEFGRAGGQMPWTLTEFYARARQPDLADFKLG